METLIGFLSGPVIRHLGFELLDQLERLLRGLVFEGVVVPGDNSDHAVWAL